MITITYEHLIVALGIIDFIFLIWLFCEILINRYLRTRNNSMKKEIERYERREVARESTKNKK